MDMSVLTVFARKRFLGKRSGQTLVEIVIAAIIAAMVPMAVFSIVLAGSGSGTKTDKKEAAALVINRARETLKSYVPKDGGGGADPRGI